MRDWPSVLMPGLVAATGASKASAVGTYRMATRSWASTSMGDRMENENASAATCFVVTVSVYAPLGKSVCRVKRTAWASTVDLGGLQAPVAATSSEPPGRAMVWSAEVALSNCTVRRCSMFQVPAGSVGVVVGMSPTAARTWYAWSTVGGWAFTE